VNEKRRIEAVMNGRTSPLFFRFPAPDKPRPVLLLTILPATSHTAVITQVDLLHGFIEPFLKGQTPKGFFEP
jgi:hypothetical protein